MLSQEPREFTPTDNDLIKGLFKQHKKLTVKFLNRKWDISSLESYVSNRMILQGLRE